MDGPSANAAFPAVPWERTVRADRSDRLHSDVVAVLLEQARLRTNMDIAWVSQFTDGRQVIETLVGDGDRFDLAAGASSPYAGSYCVRVLDGRLPNVVADSRHHPGTRDLPVTHDLGIGAYTGVPIADEHGHAIGMLCCVNRNPSHDVDASDVRFLEALAGTISALVAAPSGADHDRRHRTRDRIGRAISGAQLRAVFQPILHLGTGRIAGAEALTRFPGSSRPDEWFDQAESVGLGLALELAALQNSLSHLGDLPADTYLSLNASPRLVVSGELHAILDTLPLDRLVVELTEHAAVDDYDALLDTLHELRARGLRVAVDDVGAGFASFTHVLRLRPDIVKLDIAITRGLDRDPARRGLARALVSVARDIGATVIAEGVETQAELDALLHLGVDAAQGYVIARPAPLPLPIDYPTPTPRLLTGANGPGSDEDLITFLARTWLRSEDLEAVTRPLLDAVLDRTGLQTSYLTIADPTTGDLDHRYVRNTGPIQLPEGTVVPWADTLCKRCQDADIRWTADVPADIPGSPAAEAFGVETFLSIPIRNTTGHTIATLCAASTESRYISETILDEIELLARLLADRIPVG